MSTLKGTPTKTVKRTVTLAPSTETVDHVFPDGTKFTGTIEQLEKVAAALGLKITGIASKIPSGYYLSESKGLVKISTMNSYHIRRALIKRSKDYFTEVFDAKDTNEQFLEKYTSLTEDSCITELFNELYSRKD